MTTAKAKKPSGKNEVLPGGIPSGFQEYKNSMILGFLFFGVVYFGVIQIFDSHIVPFLNLPPSAVEFCPDPEVPCYRGDLFSFEVVSGLGLIASGILGFWTWHVQKKSLGIPDTPEGRLFGYIKQGHRLTAIGTTFQFFDLLISFMIDEQRQLLMLAHHTLAGTVSWFGLNNQYFHYYGVFYLGCSEISTIFLIFVDIAKFFPPIPGSTYDTFIGAFCGPLFAVSFIYYRVILWWPIGLQMLRDIRHVQANGMADKLRPGRNHVLYTMIVVNIVLGLLQLYWLTIILEEAMKVLG